MQRALRPCGEPGCNQLTRTGYCEQHVRTSTDTRRVYDANRTPKVKAFYQSKEWKQLRLMILAQDNHLCQMCLKAGRVTRANTVHHKIEVRDDWSKRLSPENCESVCPACHNRIHKASPGA